MAIQDGMKNIEINEIRHSVVTEAFEEGIGCRAIVMTSEFPFVFIGEIKAVEGDYLFIFAETTNISALDNLLFRVHIDDISVFYIEEDGIPIPDIC